MASCTFAKDDPSRQIHWKIWSIYVFLVKIFIIFTRMLLYSLLPLGISRVSCAINPGELRGGGVMRILIYVNPKLNL